MDATGGMAAGGSGCPRSLETPPRRRVFGARYQTTTARRTAMRGGRTTSPCRARPVPLGPLQDSSRREDPRTPPRSRSLRSAACTSMITRIVAYDTVVPTSPLGWPGYGLGPAKAAGAQNHVTKRDAPTSAPSTRTYGLSRPPDRRLRCNSGHHRRRRCLKDQCSRRSAQVAGACAGHLLLHQASPSRLRCRP